MKKVGIVYDPVYTRHETAGFFSHPETKYRVIRTVEVLEENGMWGAGADNHYIPVKPEPVDEEILKWVHTPELIKEVKRQVERSAVYPAYMDGDTPVSPGSYNAAIHAVGGNFKAVDGIFDGKFDRAFVLCRPPGHHANRSRSRGFCLFNNVILTAEYILRKKGIEKVAIVDFDVHAGNGSEDIIWEGTDSGEILFISTHRDPSSFYPYECFIEDIGSGRQKGKIVNITFPHGTTDSGMDIAIDEIIIPLLREFRPQYLLISAGFDAHHSDPIGDLRFTVDGYWNIINRLAKETDEFTGGKMSATLEGGYNISALAQSITNVIAAMADTSAVYSEDRFHDPRSDDYIRSKLIPRIKEILSPYWNSMSV